MVLHGVLLSIRVEERRQRVRVEVREVRPLIRGKGRKDGEE